MQITKRRRIASVLICLAFAIGTSVITDVSFAAETISNGSIQIIERGIILNPEVLEYAGEDSAVSDVSDEVTLTQSPEELQLQPTWQNPYYTPADKPNTRSVVKTSCTNDNYKVISKVGGEPGGGYMYDCWAGSGFYYSATAFSTYGGGVTAVCPGNNKGAIYIQGAWNNGDNWNWSTYRGPYPNNGESYCFYFNNLMKYRAVMLN